MGDADDSYDFSTVDEYLDELRRGADLVMGNRFRGGIAPKAMPFLHRYLGNPVLSFLPLIFIVAIFYFLVFMPMQKQKKQQAQMLANLQTGTDVLTTGGIVGTIISISDTTMILRVKPDNIKLQVMRSAVASLVDNKAAIEEKK